MTKHSESKAAKIRTLLAEGQKPKNVAAILDVPVTYVYGVSHYAKQRAKTARAKINQPVSKPKAKAKAKQVVRVDKPTLLELDRNRLKDELFDTKELNEQLIRSLQEATTPKIVYREVPVPQPFSHYTFLQRLRILFLGRAA